MPASPQQTSEADADAAGAARRARAPEISGAAANAAAYPYFAATAVKAGDDGGLAFGAVGVQDALRGVAVSLERARLVLAADAGAGGAAAAAVDAAVDAKLAGVATEFQRSLGAELGYTRLRSAQAKAKEYARAVARGPVPPGALADAGAAPGVPVEPLHAVFAEELAALRGGGPAVPAPDDREAQLRAARLDSKYLRFWREVHQVAQPGRNVTLPDLELLWGDEPLIVRTVESTICPVSGTTLDDPVRAPCNHVFSRAAIVGALAQTDGAMACPVFGCPGRVRARDLVGDPAMAEFVRRETQRLERETALRAESLAHV